VPSRRPSTPDLTWLADVREQRQALSAVRPIWAKAGLALPGPSLPVAERHPYCEINLVLRGASRHYAGRIQTERRAGSVFLAGPGLPHYGIIHKPTRYLTIYFLPSLLLEVGPEQDGTRLLHWFLRRTPVQPYLQPPPALFRRLVKLGTAAVTEFQQPRPGSELQLRALVLQMLVALLRWQPPGARIGKPPPPVAAWAAVDRALQFFRQHYAEPIYAQQVAAAAGVSPSRLREVFDKTLAMPWVRYLQHYRIHQAATLLAQSERNVTETALAVGFDDLAHFISVFRTTMGVTPSQYIKNVANPPAKKAKSRLAPRQSSRYRR